MIGLVIVSHSTKIAEGARELAQQISQDNLPIALAAGIDDPDNLIGTDPIRVMEAIKAVYSNDGVIVFMDLGSAVLSAETAIDLLDPAWRENIYLCSGPLIEGVVAASVQAMIGQPVRTVLAEANAALSVKHAHFAESSFDSFGNALYPNIIPTANVHELRLLVPNKLGLHARPAAQVVKIASHYKARLLIRNKERLANAHSINQIAILGARQGDELIFLADGEDAELLLKAIQAFATDNFGERLSSSAKTSFSDQPESNHPAHVLTGIPASKGIAIAEAYSMATFMPDVTVRKVRDYEAEGLRLQAAINSVAQELKELANHSRQRLGQHEASIFEAQVLILHDPELLKATGKRFIKDKINAEAVWWEVVEQLAQRYGELEDPLLDERANDIRDLGRRVLRKLDSDSLKPAQPAKPYILLVSELSASDLAQLDESLVMGIVIEKGGVSSHSAIIARALGVPAVIGFSDISKIQSGQEIALDGEKGWVWTALSLIERSKLEEATQQWLNAREKMRLASKEAAITVDGKRIELAANISKVEDVRKAIEVGAEGVGLLRTEFLFMNRDSLPTEDEQFEQYSQIAQTLNGYPLIIRALDIGGDKPIKALPLEFEANPFLGYRGIRLWLDAPEIYTSQLRAIYRASAFFNVKLMLPMLSTIGELERTKQIMRTVQAKLNAEAIPYNPEMELGIMIEVPSTVFMAEQLAERVDFFSIGTNDLSQYIMAADRNHARLHHLVNYFQPAVLQAIKHTIDCAHRANIWVSICGEMAGDPLAIPLLMAMGIDKLSMNAPAIPEAKEIIRSSSSVALGEMLDELLGMQSPESIKARLQIIMQDIYVAD